MSPGLTGWIKAALVAAACGASAAPARAVFIAPEFAGAYTATDLGPVTGLPTPYGGLTFLAGDPNTLLIGGSANQGAGAIYRAPVIRNASNQIVGLGAATLFATAPNIDGGLAYAPNGVLLYTGYPVNQLGQIRPGSTSPDRILNLGPLGIASSVGSLAFIPDGYPGAGGFRLVSWSGGQTYSATLVQDTTGLFTLGSITQGPTLPGGPEGIAYVPLGSALFPNPSVLVSEYSAGLVSVYTLDANGNPILSSRRLFAGDVAGAEGALIDPLTGDFLFSTFGTGQDRVIRVSGFTTPTPPDPTAVPAPPAAVLALVGGAALLGGRRLRRRTA